MIPACKNIGIFSWKEMAKRLAHALHTEYKLFL